MFYTRAGFAVSVARLPLVASGLFVSQGVLKNESGLAELRQAMRRHSNSHRKSVVGFYIESQNPRKIGIRWQDRLAAAVSAALKKTSLRFEER
ncbi:MAG: hypothetical protein OHK0029_37290 [Armatimonadaceae bacterium]